MFLRYASATCALLYGLLIGYVLVSWWLGGYHIDYIRCLQVAVALFCGIAVLGGASPWLLFAGTGMVLVWELIAYHGANSIMLVLIFEGVWRYSKLDIVPFASLLLSSLAVVFSVMAEGRLHRSIRFVRYWPHHRNV